MMDIRQSTIHDVSHRHGRSCYWDHRRAGWTCPSSAALPLASAGQRELVTAG
jgi:hypothetical protein